MPQARERRFIGTSRAAATVAGLSVAMEVFRLKHLPFAALLALAAAPALAARFEFVALGDMPYDAERDPPRFERLIDAINRVKPAFSVHVGDTKSGAAPCSDAWNARVAGWFGRFEQPLVYTPGDNEWTDCHRRKAGGHDPLERLAKLRETFFAEPRSLGKAPMPLATQPQESAFEATPENARWERDGIVFATVHVVGSNNNFEARNRAAAAEFFERNAANLAWIAAAFERARAVDARGLVLLMQAELLATQDGHSGYADTVKAIVRGAEAFARPVLVVHGDYHTFVVDHPFRTGDGKKALMNVTRLQVYGENDVAAVRVAVDTDDPALWSFRPLLVPENLTGGGNAE